MIFAGGIGVGTSIVASFALREFMSSASEGGVRIQSSIVSAGWLGTLKWIIVTAFGGALYYLSAGIARHLTSEPEVAVQASVRPEGGRI